MGKTTRGSLLFAALWAGLAAPPAGDLSAAAQALRQEPSQLNQRQVYLVRKDEADCTGSDVPNVDSPLVGGTIWITRLPDGKTGVQVAMTARPSTTYRFFLKCVRQLAEITTDEEGVANVAFDFPTDLVGAVYAFDMYPDDAPAGSKYQSAQVSFQ
jgi:hypothetical protein